LTTRIRYFLREALVNLFRARAVNALTIGIITASLFILGGFLLLVTNLKAAAEEWNQVAVIVYLQDEAPPERVEALRERLAGEEITREIRYISREEAAEIFSERFSHLAEAAAEVGGSPFPASIEILARGDRDERASLTATLIESLRSNPLVEEVRDNEAEAGKVLALIRVVSLGGWVIGGILAMASLFTIFNVIRLTVYQRRDEISIMRLVGATGAFIRGPFLLEGTLQGAIGAVMAVILLFLAYGRLEAYAVASENPFLQLLAAGFLSPSQAGALAAAGTLLGATGSLLSLRRFLAD
jgi:cell division transport system permease protein